MSVFRLGYNTNGLAHHRLDDALRLLAELGYGGVAITPDVGQLDPQRSDARDLEAIAGLAADLDLTIAIETGARFLLDPKRKHFPTLLEEDLADRYRRLRFLIQAIETAAALGAEVVTIFSGMAPGGERAEDEQAGAARLEVLWERLCEGIAGLLATARERGVRIGFEPEPGMFLERPAAFLELRRRLGSAGEDLGLTLDVGHLLCTDDLPAGRVISELREHLVHVHLADIRGRVHHHRPFGEGDLDLEDVLSSLNKVGYGGMAAVELSRDSHRGAQAAEEALTRIRDILGPGA
ncbi:MAG: sugar phosphate isomerase/epimerase [Planctomycetota bacterium]|nr:sugar phosphate isomerase/epimerase [Planctomycetota bacterium]